MQNDRTPKTSDNASNSPDNSATNTKSKSNKKQKYCDVCFANITSTAFHSKNWNMCSDCIQKMKVRRKGSFIIFLLISVGLLTNFLLTVQAKTSWKFAAAIAILGGIYGFISIFLTIWLAHHKIIPIIILFASCYYPFALSCVGIACFVADLFGATSNETPGKRKETLFTGYWFVRLLCHYESNRYATPFPFYSDYHPAYTPPPPLRYQVPIYKSTSFLLQRQDLIDTNKGAEGEYNVFRTLELLLGPVCKIKVA